MLCKRNLSTKQAFGNPSFHSIMINSIWLEHILPCITFVPGFWDNFGFEEHYSIEWEVISSKYTYQFKCKTC